MPEEEDAVVEESVEDNPEAAAPDEVVGEPDESYTIKIDGGEEQVSLDELRNGYQRQADYTRKTQEIATERQRLSQAEAIVAALESDPSGTIQALARSFDVAVDTGTKASDLSDDSWNAEDDDPQIKRITELEGRLEAQERNTRQQAIQKEVTELQDRYGEFDSQQLFSHALKKGIGNLEAALKDMRYDGLTAEADKLRDELSVLDKKREGAALVESGGSKQPSAIIEPSQEAGTLREAFAMALKQHS